MEQLQREFLEYLRFKPQRLAAHGAGLRDRPPAVPRLRGAAPGPRGGARGPWTAPDPGLPRRPVRAGARPVVVGPHPRRHPVVLPLPAARGRPRRQPAALVSPPRPERRMPAHLDVDDMEALLAAPDAATPLGRRDRAILELLYASGLRLSELVGLDLDDVNHGGRLVRVRGKGGRERIVPFHRRAGDAIRDYLPARRALCAGAASPPAGAGSGPGRDPLFVNYRGGPVGAQRRPSPAPLRRAVERPAGHQPARAAPLVRDPPAGAGRRPALHPGAAGARARQHDPALHPRQRRPDHQPLPQDAPRA